VFISLNLSGFSHGIASHAALWDRKAMEARSILVQNNTEASRQYSPRARHSLFFSQSHIAERQNGKALCAGSFLHNDQNLTLHCAADFAA
jgi:hypothetical protein